MQVGWPIGCARACTWMWAKLRIIVQPGYGIKRRYRVASYILYELWHGKGCPGVIVNEYRRTQRTCRVLRVCSMPWLHASADSVFLAAATIQCFCNVLWTPDIYFRTHVLRAYCIHATCTRHIHAHQWQRQRQRQQLSASRRRRGVTSISSMTPSGRDLQPRANETSLPREIEIPRDVSKTLRTLLLTPVYCDSQEKSEEDNTDYCSVFLLQGLQSLENTRSIQIKKNLTILLVC